ncbi:MAG TPA: BrxA/BrxB family bacilliredoxin, partial [Thermoanaerobaculia bacterium]
MTAPMREELTRVGFKELRTAGEVDAEVAAASDPLLLVVNSICGCAAGIARPGILMSLSHPK